MYEFSRSIPFCLKIFQTRHSTPRKCNLGAFRGILLWTKKYRGCSWIGISIKLSTVATQRGLVVFLSLQPILIKCWFYPRTSFFVKEIGYKIDQFCKFQITYCQLFSKYCVLYLNKESDFYMCCILSLVSHILILLTNILRSNRLLYCLFKVHRIRPEAIGSHRGRQREKKPCLLSSFLRKS